MEIESKLKQYLSAWDEFKVYVEDRTDYEWDKAQQEFVNLEDLRSMNSLETRSLLEDFLETKKYFVQYLYNEYVCKWNWKLNYPSIPASDKRWTKSSKPEFDYREDAYEEVIPQAFKLLEEALNG